ncbi:hypothetical protein DXA78_02745 [Bacteroides fragilis]|nr:hypothetical protein DXA81_02750 [Bacteroides fragilis]RGP15743.1 hypothetical protein DXA78_02745 [Bacteroides fragilis]
MPDMGVSNNVGLKDKRVRVECIGGKLADPMPYTTNGGQIALHCNSSTVLIRSFL